MPHHGLHWNGYPHHHLPRIRVASTGAVNTRGAHLAAQNVVRLPFGLALEKARAQQVYRVRRRQKRRSRASSNLISRRLASLKAGQRIQINGWNTSCANIASLQNSLPPPIVERGVSTPSQQLQGLTDGASCSKAARSSRRPHQDSHYPLMQVAEAKPYFGDREKPGRGKKPDGEEGSEYAHVSDINTVHKRTAFHNPHFIGSRIYDPRLPANHSGLSNRNESIASHSVTSVQSRRYSITSKRPKRTKIPGVFPKDIKRVLNTTVSTAKSVSSGIPPIVLEDLPFRSVSRQKSLDRFTRGLEKHLVAQKALRDASLATTTTESCLSTRTIVQLLPYIEEFRADGLAVTSSDQRCHSKGKGRKQGSQNSKTDCGVVTNSERDSGMTNNSVTRPPETICSTASGSASSCSTVVVFPMQILPSDETSFAPDYFPRKSAKKILPWLRKETLPNESHIKPTALSCDDSVASSTTTIIDFSLHPTSIRHNGKGKSPNYPHFKTHDKIIWGHPDYYSSVTALAEGASKALSDTSPTVRRSPVQKDKRSLPPSRSPPSVPGFNPQNHLSTSVAGQIPPLHHSRNHSTLLHGAEMSPENPSQRSVDQLPDISVRDLCDHEKTSPLEEFGEVIKAFGSSEGEFLQARVTSDKRNKQDNHSVNTGPVKRAPDPPYRPPSSRHSEPAAPTTPRESPVAKTSAKIWHTLSSEDVSINDRDLLKGLQVALAAVCDEAIDIKIEATTGRSVRRMLANLSFLDPLGVNSLTAAARRKATVRREELRGLERALDGWPSSMVPPIPRMNSKGIDRSLGLVAADEGIDGAVERM